MVFELLRSKWRRARRPLDHRHFWNTYVDVFNAIEKFHSLLPDAYCVLAQSRQYIWCPLIISIDVNRVSLKIIHYGKTSLRWGAAIAQWICLRLPSCCRGFTSQSHHQHFYQFKIEFKLWRVEKTKINKKKPGLAHLLNKKTSIIKKQNKISKI